MSHRAFLCTALSLFGLLLTVTVVTAQGNPATPAPAAPVPTTPPCTPQPGCRLAHPELLPPRELELAHMA